MIRWAATVIVLACAGLATGQTYISPEEAAKDPDFAVQGEYRGELDTGNQKLVLAAQIIALGDGRFRMVTFSGGLPGDVPNAPKHESIETKRADGKVVFVDPTDDKSRVEIVDGEAHYYEGGNKMATLKRVQRKSKTLGKKAPEGAVVLFDGSEESIKNWKGKGAKLSKEGYLQQGITSTKKFGDCTIHVEFLLPYKPKASGQGRGNSGLYVQGRYETQMLDSFGLKGEHNECGGIYSIKKPDVNMCYPPLSWQTYDIEFTAAKFDDAGKKTASARMTVYHNGVKIHDDVELPKSTTASPLKDGPGPGPLYLQDHGNPVRYRNIWVLPSN